MSDVDTVISQTAELIDIMYDRLRRAAETRLERVWFERWEAVDRDWPQMRQLQTSAMNILRQLSMRPNFQPFLAEFERDLTALSDQLAALSEWQPVVPDPNMRFEHRSREGELIDYHFARGRDHWASLERLDSLHRAARRRLGQFAERWRIYLAGSAVSDPADEANRAKGDAAPTEKLTGRQELILCEMLALEAIGETKAVTRDTVVKKACPKNTVGDLARDFGKLRNLGYTDSLAGPDGGVWLTGKGKTKAAELVNENAQ